MKLIKRRLSKILKRKTKSLRRSRKRKSFRRKSSKRTTNEKRIFKLINNLNNLLNRRYDGMMSLRIDQNLINEAVISLRSLDRELEENLGNLYTYIRNYFIYISQLLPYNIGIFIHMIISIFIASYIPEKLSHIISNILNHIYAIIPADNTYILPANTIKSIKQVINYQYDTYTSVVNGIQNLLSIIFNLLKTGLRYSVYTVLSFIVLVIIADRFKLADCVILNLAIYYKVSRATFKNIINTGADVHCYNMLSSDIRRYYLDILAEKYKDFEMLKYLIDNNISCNARISDKKIKFASFGTIWVDERRLISECSNLNSDEIVNISAADYIKKPSNFIFVLMGSWNETIDASVCYSREYIPTLINVNSYRWKERSTGDIYVKIPIGRDAYVNILEIIEIYLSDYKVYYLKNKTERNSGSAQYDNVNRSVGSKTNIPIYEVQICGDPEKRL